MSLYQCPLCHSRFPAADLEAPSALLICWRQAEPRNLSHTLSADDGERYRDCVSGSFVRGIQSNFRVSDKGEPDTVDNRMSQRKDTLERALREGKLTPDEMDAWFNPLHLDRLLAQRDRVDAEFGEGAAQAAVGTDPVELLYGENAQERWEKEKAKVFTEKPLQGAVAKDVPNDHMP